MAQAKTEAGSAISVLENAGRQVRQRNLWQDALRRLMRNRFAVVGLLIVLSFLVLALIAPLIQRYNPAFQDYSAILTKPSAKHWLGTDDLGRDQYSRVVNGARISLQVGVITQVIIVALGMLVGGVAAVAGGWIDNLLMRFTDIIYAFPDLLLIILVQAILGAGLIQIFFAIGLVNWVTIARLVRGQILSLRERDFVTAARATGASDTHILIKHLFPNTLSPIIVAVTFGIPGAIFAEAALSFIGIGLPPPTPSWGRLITDGYQAIYAVPTLIVAPALCVAIVLMGFTFLGDGLRDALDPRSR